MQHFQCKMFHTAKEAKNMVSIPESQRWILPDLESIHKILQKTNTSWSDLKVWCTELVILAQH